MSFRASGICRLSIPSPAPSPTAWGENRPCRPGSAGRSRRRLRWHDACCEPGAVLEQPGFVAHYLGRLLEEEVLGKVCGAVIRGIRGRLAILDGCPHFVALLLADGRAFGPGERFGEALAGGGAGLLGGALLAPLAFVEGHLVLLAQLLEFRNVLLNELEALVVLHPGIVARLQYGQGFRQAVEAHVGGGLDAHPRQGVVEGRL